MLGGSIFWWVLLSPLWFFRADCWNWECVSNLKSPSAPCRLVGQLFSLSSCLLLLIALANRTVGCMPHNIKQPQKELMRRICPPPVISSLQNFVVAAPADAFFLLSSVCRVMAGDPLTVQAGAGNTLEDLQEKDVWVCCDEQLYVPAKCCAHRSFSAVVLR